METERRYRGGGIRNDALIGGLSLALWFDAYEHCHNAQDEQGDVFVAWPDGGAYADQDNITVEMFDVIRNTREKVKEQVRKSRRQRRR